MSERIKHELKKRYLKGYAKKATPKQVQEKIAPETFEQLLNNYLPDGTTDISRQKGTRQDT